jgi:hypothetical protein
MSSVAAFLWATAGGFAISVLDYSALAAVPRRQRRVSFTDPAYLLKFMGHPLIGGLLAASYAASRADATPLTVVILGAAAPGIWRTFVRSASAIARLLLRQLPGQVASDSTDSEIVERGSDSADSDARSGRV